MVPGNPRRGVAAPEEGSAFSRFVFSTPTGRNLVRFVIAIAVLGFIINITKFILRGHRDVEIFFFAAQQLVAGGEIYSVEAPTGGFYIYLPLFAFLLIPFTFLPTWAATFLWTGLNVFGVWAIIASLFRTIVGRAIADIEFKERLVITALALLPCADFLISNMRNGQSNVFVLALTVAALDLYRRESEFLSGMTIGVAGVIKIFSLPLAVWMFLQRRLSVMAGVVLGITIGLLLPAVILGWSKNLSLVSHWVTQILANRDIVQHYVPFEFNTSYEAILLKLFTDVPAFTYDNTQYSVTIATVDARIVSSAGVLLSVLTLTLLIIYWRRFQSGHRIAREVGGPILAMLIAPMLTPITEKYHLVFVLPAYIYIVVLNRYFGLSDRKFVGLALLSFIFEILTLKLVWGDYFSKLWFSHGGLILCVFSLFAAIFRAGKLLDARSAAVEDVDLVSRER